jgi:phosphatidylinositol kinase/protein kinase (PI-3  family)
MRKLEFQIIITEAQPVSEGWVCFKIQLLAKNTTSTDWVLLDEWTVYGENFTKAFFRIKSNLNRMTKKLTDRLSPFAFEIPFSSWHQETGGWG